MIYNQFVKPGKGSAFNRTKVKHMITGRVVEKTYKSGETVDLAEIEEESMRLLCVRCVGRNGHHVRMEPRNHTSR